MTDNRYDGDDREIALLRADLAAEGLLPDLPTSLEPTAASAAAMLARVKQMAATQTPQPPETTQQPTPTTTFESPTPAVVVPTKNPISAHRGMFALAASIVLATAVAIPLVNRATHPETVVVADAPIEATVQNELVPERIAPRGAVDLEADAAWQFQTSVAWTAEPGVLSVITIGSSSCPTLAEPTAVAEGSGVRIALERSSAEACTADSTATESLVTVPADLDNGAPLSVWIGAGEYVVQPRPAADSPGPRAVVETNG